VIISQFPYPLRFSPSDLVVRPLEELAKEMRVSRAFLRLCVVAGCPVSEGGASAGQVLIWLFEHYADFRAIAGLKPLAPVEDLPVAAMAHLRMSNALITLLEFGRTRATRWRQKRQLRLALEHVDRLADRTA
jgi:hypothetical protein